MIYDLKSFNAKYHGGKAGYRIAKLKKNYF